MHGRNGGIVAGLVLLSSLAATAGLGGEPVQPRPVGTGFEARGFHVRLERTLDRVNESAARSVWRRIAGRKREALFERPYGVAWIDDDLVVTDPAAGAVIRVTVDGRVVARPRRSWPGPIGVAVCAAGVVVTDSRAGTVDLLDGDLAAVGRLAEGLERPTGVGCVGDRIFVAETAAHRIVSLEVGGTSRPEESGARFTLFAGRRGSLRGEFNFPTAITVNDGSVWVGDTLNFRVQRLTVDSAEVRQVFGGLGDAPGEMPRLKGLDVDRAGRLWVSDAFLNQVSIFAADGSYLTSFGRSGQAGGEFSFPAGVAVHRDGRVAVVDSLNRRIQIFRLEEVEDGH